MKILRQQTKTGYASMVNEGYCCDAMRRMRGTFGFHSDGTYCLENEISLVIEEVHFCPFCGEKFVVIYDGI